MLESDQGRRSATAKTVSEFSAKPTGDETEEDPSEQLVLLSVEHLRRGGEALDIRVYEPAPFVANPNCHGLRGV